MMKKVPELTIKQRMERLSNLPPRPGIHGPTEGYLRAGLAPYFHAALSIVMGAMIGRDNPNLRPEFDYWTASQKDSFHGYMDEAIEFIWLRVRLYYISLIGVHEFDSQAQPSHLMRRETIIGGRVQCSVAVDGPAVGAPLMVREDELDWVLEGLFTAKARQRILPGPKLAAWLDELEKSDDAPEGTTPIYKHGISTLGSAAPTRRAIDAELAKRGKKRPRGNPGKK